MNGKKAIFSTVTGFFFSCVDSVWFAWVFGFL